MQSTTLAQCVHRMALSTPEAVALQAPIENVKFTYAQLSAQVRRPARVPKFRAACLEAAICLPLASPPPRCDVGHKCSQTPVCIASRPAAYERSLTPVA